MPQSPKTLKNWYIKEGIGDLWCDEAEDREEILILLAGESQWDDVQQICADLKIPKLKIAYLKGYLLKRALIIKKAQNDDKDNDNDNNDTQPANIVINKDDNKRNDNNKKKNDAQINKNNQKNNKNTNQNQINQNKRQLDKKIIQKNSKQTTTILDKTNKMNKNDQIINDRTGDVDVGVDIDIDAGTNPDGDDDNNVTQGEYLTHYASNGFQYNSIPILSTSDDYMKYFSDGKCFVLRGNNLLGSCLNTWTPQYLAKKLQNQLLDVLVSNTREFRYFNMDKNFGEHKFNPPNKTVKMTMNEFISKVNDKDKNKNKNDKYYYLQSSLNSECCGLIQDFSLWNWSEYLNIARTCSWGPLTSNLLLIGMSGNNTPAHYDEQENIFIQLNGYKEIILIDPSISSSLYPFPYGHPCDRQSMINVEYGNNSESLKYFPKFTPSSTNQYMYRTVIGPGDILYIPSTWWHEITNLNDFSMSITFWSLPKVIMDQKNNKQFIDINQIFNKKTISQKIAIGRNIEKMVLEQFGGKKQIQILKSFINNNPKYTKYRNDIKKILKNVFNEKDIDNFMYQLVKGRYDCPFQQFVSRNGLNGYNT